MASTVSRSRTGLQADLPVDVRLMQALTNGADFAQPVCRTALGIAADLPPGRAPAGRRVYLFDPRSWTEDRFTQVRERVEAWGTAH